MKKQMLTALVIGTMAMSLLSPISVATTNASESDVTSSMKKNKKVNYFAEQVNWYVEMETAAKDYSGTKKVKLTDSKKVDIVCAALFGKGSNKDVDFDDDIKDGSYICVKNSSIKKNYKKMFGESVDLSNIEMTSKDVTKKKNDKFYYKDINEDDEDRGDAVYTITSIYKNSSDVLTVDMTNDLKNPQTGIKYFNLGNTTMKLKKTSSGDYMLKKVTYTVSNKDVPDEKNFNSYASILNNLKDGQAYAFVDMSDSIDALLVTSQTYRYDSKTVAAIEATVYGLNSRGKVVECGKVSSSGTAYPLAIGNSNHCLYYGSGHSVKKVTLKNNTSLYTVESASEEFDSSGRATYYFNGATVSNNSYLKRLYTEWYQNSKIVNFTTI